jgi:hypothetical protein
MYKGPSDSAIIEFITLFGSRTASTYEEICYQFGHHEVHTEWPESIPQKLTRMVGEGKLTYYVKNGVEYYAKDR